MSGWTEEESGLYWTGDWAFDFSKMTAYRGSDVRNRRTFKDRGVEIRFIDGRICSYRPWIQKWNPFWEHGGKRSTVDDAYKKWVDDEIEKIVL